MASRCSITGVQIIVCLNKRTVKYIAICAIIAFNVYLLRRYYYGAGMDRKSRSILWNGNGSNIQTPPVNQLLHAFNLGDSYYAATSESDIPPKNDRVAIISESPQKQENRSKYRYARMNEIKTVLIWPVPFDDITMSMEYLFDKVDYSRNTTELLQNGFHFRTPLCGNCKFTYDQKQQKNADAILFHGLDVSTTNLPSKQFRTPQQLYVYWTMESLPVSKVRQPTYLYKMKKFNGFFNATMTYRLNSDIYSPYGSISWILKLLWYKSKGITLLERLAGIKFVGTKPRFITTRSNLELYLKNLNLNYLNPNYEIKPPHISSEVWKLVMKKARLATWIVSNCGHYYSNDIDRKTYVNLLVESGLQVDVFGKCGNPFPVESRWDPAFFNIVSRYKFYFSFENTLHCKDYISEKLWYNALYSGTVPVIFGSHRDDVAAVLPPKSYILVEDYSDYHDLLKYLHYLDQNVSAYAEYLEWRSWVKYLDENGEFHPENFKNVDNIKGETLLVLQKYATTKPLSFCALCSRLHQVDLPQKTLNNLTDYIKNDRSECNDATRARDMFWKSQKHQQK